MNRGVGPRFLGADVIFSSRIRRGFGADMIRARDGFGKKWTAWVDSSLNVVGPDRQGRFLRKKLLIKSDIY